MNTTTRPNEKIALLPQRSQNPSNLEMKVRFEIGVLRDNRHWRAAARKHAKNHGKRIDQPVAVVVRLNLVAGLLQHLDAPCSSLKIRVRFVVTVFASANK